MLTQGPQRLGHRTTAPPCRLLRQHFHRPVHPDGENLLDIGQIGIDRAMLDIGPEPPDRRLDHRAIAGMHPHNARQAQQFHRPLQRQSLRRPALGQTGAWRLGRGLTRLALLHIGAKTPGPQADLGTVHLAQHPPVRRAALIAARNRPGKAALGIVAAPDERPARARRFQMQPPDATGRANPRVRPIGARRIQMRRHKFVNLLQHFTDPQISRLSHRRREIAPEPRQHILVLPLTRRNIVQLGLQIGGEIILDIAAEKVGQERRHQPPLVLGDQAVLVLADIFTVNNRRQHRSIGRGPPDAQLLHPLDQGGLAIARRSLGEMLLAGDGLLLGPLVCHDLRQTTLVILLVVAPLVIDLQEPVEQHDLAIGPQANLPIG